MRYLILSTWFIAGCFSANNNPICGVGSQPACVDGSVQFDFAMSSDAGNTCSNGVQDGTETDIDCGGGSCPQCGFGSMCQQPGDCASGKCTNNVCASPINCMAPSANCDGVAAHGCNVNTDTDAKNCGACGTVCPINAPSCNGGRCKSVACPNGFAFANHVEYPFASNGFDLVARDLNGDGKPDLAVVADNVTVVSVYLNMGGGVLAPKVDYPTGMSPRSVAIGDFNGDGKPDLVTANLLSSNVSVLLNQGGGLFAAKVDYGVINEPWAVAVGDLNGDGKPDLAVAQYNKDSASVLLNKGGGVFGGQVDYPTDLAPTFIAIADLNGDGKPDLLTASGVSNSIDLLFNTGNGFSPKVAYAIAGPRIVAIGDLDGDGKPDLAVSNPSAAMVSVMHTNGGGVFAAPIAYATRRDPWGVAITDLDGDGKPDLAVACETGDNLGCYTSLLRNTGAGFAPRVDVMSAPCPRGIAAADLNGDGKPDLAETIGNGFVSVLLNTCK